MSEVVKGLVEVNGVKVEKEIIREQSGFDGITGQPVYSYRMANGFDGMTGAPIYVDVEQIEFDGATGIPVFGFKGSRPVARTPVKRIRNNEPVRDLGSMKYVIIAAGAVLLVAIVAVILVVSGVFMSNRDKVLKATYETIEDSTIGESILNAIALLQSDELTADVDARINEDRYSGKINATVAQDASKGRLSFNADAEVSGLFSQELDFYFDDSSIQMALPEINDDVYYYDYTADNKGDLDDLVSEYSDGTLDDVNTMFKSFNSIFRSKGKYQKNLRSELKKAYKKVEVTGIDPETFDVDGKSRKCKGYEMRLTRDNFEDFVRAFSDANDKTYGEDTEEMARAMSSLSGDDDFEEIYNDVRDSEDIAEEMMDGSDDIYIDFYLYGGKLAGVVFSNEYEEFTIEFLGGDRRCSNINVTERSKTSDRKEQFSLESSIKNDMEKGNFYVNDTSVGSYSYDVKSGEFSIDIMGMDNIDGIFLAKKNILTFRTEFSDYGMSGSVEVNAENKARIAEIKGERLDIGDLSESELKKTVTRLFTESEDAFDGLEYLF